MACRIGELVLDCRDPEVLARFWCEVLDFVVLDREDGAIEIGPREGFGGAQPTIILSPHPDPTPGKLRLHIDVNPTDRDQDAELERLLRLGARPTDIGQPADAPWHVLADPEGNVFCLLRRRLDPAPPGVGVAAAGLPAPADGILVTQFLTVRDVARSRDFYSRVLGGTVVVEENPCIVRLANSWVIMNPGGGPTPDKPEISVVDHVQGDTVSTFMNLRVADARACYEAWSALGAEFLTEPLDRGAEVRCYLRDPDGYLIEVGQSTGLLRGEHAAKRPEDLPG